MSSIAAVEPTRHGDSLARAGQVGQLWAYRRWIWDGALSDLRHRYAGSGLGVLWNVVNPLVTLAVYAFIFTYIMLPRLGEARSNLPFALYLSCGFLPWMTFADGLFRSSHAFLANASYLKKLPVPEIVFVAQTSMSTLVSMLVAVVLLLLLSLLLGLTPRWSWSTLPAIVLIWQLFGFGLGLSLSAINVFFRDVGQILGVLTQVWMWSVPVVYFEDLLPDAYRATLAFNPAYPFVVALRSAVLDTVPEPALWGGMVAWSAVALLSGIVVLNRLRSELRDLL